MQRGNGKALWLAKAEKGMLVRPVEKHRTVVPTDQKRFGRMVRIHYYTPGRITRILPRGRLQVAFGENLLGGPMETELYATGLEPVEK